MGSKTGSWERLGGTISSTASAVSFGLGRLDVFARGADFSLRHRSLNSSVWSPDWQNLGGSLASPPAAKLRLPNQYRFSVDLVHVTTTRSLDADTDAASASVGAGNWAAQTKTQWIGDIGGLTDPKESQTNLLNFEPVSVELCEPAVFSYLVLNNGHASQKTIDAALVKAGTKITSDSISSISKDLGAGIGAIIGVEIGGSILVPVIGSLLGSLTEWLLGQLGNFIFADCGGVVAAEQAAFTGVELHLKTAGAPLSVTTSHPGTDSATGCGDNSQYEVTWTISQL